MTTPRPIHRLSATLTLGLVIACNADPDDAAGESGATETAAVSDTGAPTTTTGDDAAPETATADESSGTTGSACPVNICSGHDDVGACDELLATACVVGADGCRVPGETTACATACLAGVCCDDFGGIDCECVSNPCLDNALAEGWHCVDDQEVYCIDAFGCVQPFNGTPTACADGCEAQTGTCGGCVPDSCYTEIEGRIVCAAGGGPQAATCALVDGCMQETMHTPCAVGCVYGQGCVD